MERCIMNADGLNSVVHNIGCTLGDGTFLAADECLDTLQEVTQALAREDKRWRHVRIQLGMLDIIPTALAPLIIHIGEEPDEVDDKEDVFNEITKILADLTQPMECLFPNKTDLQGLSSQTHAGIIHLLASAQEAFCDPQLVRWLLQHLQDLITDVANCRGFTNARECLFSVMERGACNSAGHEKHTSKDIGDIDKLLLSGAFGNFYWEQLHQRGVSRKLQDGVRLPETSCTTVNHCLFLLRNLLYVPDFFEHSLSKPKAFSTILWLLFENGLQDILTLLVTAEQRECWCELIVQMISLMYKEQKNMYSDEEELSSFSKNSDFGSSSNKCTPSRSLESPATVSEENEKDSGNSLQGNLSPGAVVPDLLSEDILVGSTTPVECVKCGVHGCSCSNKDNPLVAPPFKMQDLASLVSSELLAWQLGEKLGDFTMVFLEKMFHKLIPCVKVVLMTPEKCQLEDLYLLWMVGHFLKLASKVHAPFAWVSECLSIDIVGYMVYMAAVSSEQVLLAQEGKKKDVSGPIRKNYLVVSALRQIFNTFHRYSSSRDLTQAERDQLHMFEACLIGVQDVRCMPLALIRHYQPHLHCQRYLEETVLINHQFLLIAENVLSRNKAHQYFDLLDYVSGFATTEVMEKYSQVLQHFHKNSAIVNECVFTIMHHVAGDCSQSQALLQVPIIKMFMEIGDDEDAIDSLSEDCMDLIHHTLEQFISLTENDLMGSVGHLFGDLTLLDSDENDQPNSSGGPSGHCSSRSSSSDLQRSGTSSSCSANKRVVSDFEDASSPSDRASPKSECSCPDCNSPDSFRKSCDSSDSGQYGSPHGPKEEEDCYNWSEEEVDIVYAMYCENEESEELVDLIVKALKEKGFVRSQAEVIVQLATQGMWHFPMNQSLNKKPEEKRKLNLADMVAESVAKIKEQGDGRHLSWLQNVLTETCYVKLGGRSLNKEQLPEEPIALHHVVLGKSVPIFPYSADQERILQDKHFSLILQNMGFHMGADTCLVYPRIPHFWAADDLLHKAEQLGPLDMSTLKFTLEDVKEHATKSAPHDVGDTGIPQPDTGPCDHPEALDTQLWHLLVQKCNISNQ